MLITKLPLEFQKDVIISTIAKFIQKGDVLYSSIIYKNLGKTFIINKNENTPYFSKDWQCYSLLRAMSNTLITTGSILRNQKETFLSKLEFGDQNIQKMYQNVRRDKKQDVYVMTKSIKSQQILNYFNTDLYKLLPQYNEANQSKEALYDILQNLKKQNKTPILVQCGTNIMNNYFLKVLEKKIQNQIDSVLLTFYQGQLNNLCVGAQFKLYLQQALSCVWQSDPIDVFDKDKNKIGIITFKVYKKHD